MTDLEPVCTQAPPPPTMGCEKPQEAWGDAGERFRKLIFTEQDRSLGELPSARERGRLCVSTSFCESDRIALKATQVRRNSRKPQITGPWIAAESKQHFLCDKQKNSEDRNQHMPQNANSKPQGQWRQCRGIACEGSSVSLWGLTNWACWNKLTIDRLKAGKRCKITVMQLCLGVTQNTKLTESECVPRLKLQCLLYKRPGGLGAIGNCRQAVSDFWRDGQARGHCPKTVLWTLGTVFEFQCLSPWYELNLPR